MARRTYKEIADSLVNQDWGWDGAGDDVNAHINSLTEAQKTVVLLVDIAKSLRVLRCHNFIDVPRRLDAIRRASEGLRREQKNRAAVRRRKYGRL